MFSAVIMSTIIDDRFSKMKYNKCSLLIILFIVLYIIINQQVYI